MKLLEAIQGYEIAKRASNLSVNTVDLYMYQLAHFSNYFGDVEISEIDEEQLLELMVYFKNEYRTKAGHPLAPSSREKLYLALKSFYKWAGKNLDAKRVDLVLEKPKYRSPETIPFTHEEVARLFKACHYTRRAKTTRRKSYQAKRGLGRRDTAILLVLLDTGIRASELCRLNVGDAILEEGELRIQPYSTGSKTKPRSVFIGARSREALWRYLVDRVPYHDDHPLFVSAANRRMTRDSLRHLLMRLGERAEVPNVYPHRFRHTFAIEFLRNDGDVFTLKRLLGHSTLTMVQNYLAIAKTDTRNAHRKASPVDRIIP